MILCKKNVYSAAYLINIHTYYFKPLCIVLREGTDCWGGVLSIDRDCWGRTTEIAEYLNLFSL